MVNRLFKLVDNDFQYLLLFCENAPKPCSQMEENTNIINPAFERIKSIMMDQSIGKYLKVVSDLKQK